jgi:large subunit ribosomal protein L9
MEVILLEKTSNGNIGDKVSVKSGFARNFLIPFGKAIPATADNISVFESRRAELEEKAKQKHAEAEARAATLNGLSLTISAQASDEGKLYGSVSTIEVMNAILEAGQSVEKREIILPEGPIHQVGEFDIQVQVHSDIVADIKVTVVAAK